MPVRALEQFRVAEVRSPKDESAGFAERICICAILAGLALALAFQAWRVGVTVDEPSHLVSARLYWRGADRLAPGDMPPLTKIVGGWVPNLFALPLPADLGRPGDNRHEWWVALSMMDQLKQRIPKVFFFSRLPFMIFPLLTAFLLWRWGRQLFRPWVGVLLALAFALEPTALAHGALFKNDLAATCTYLLFWFTAWKYWQDPRTSRAAWFGAATFLAMISKLSMLFVIGVAPCVVLLRCLTRRQPGLRRAAVALALVLLIPYIGILAAYQFDTRTLSVFEWRAWVQHPQLPWFFTGPAVIFQVLPLAKQMWNGCVTLLVNNAETSSVYMLGRLHPHGSILYFLLALLVKIPAPLLALIAAGAMFTAGALRRKQLRFADVFWLLPGLLYIGLASMATLQLGVRLVLPALPFGLLLCGMALDRLWKRNVFPLLLLAWLAWTSASIYPRGIAFMNLWAGGPENGLRYLSGSNLDWGQGLPDLAAYVRKHKIGRIRLAYFGTDTVWRFFRDEEVEPVPIPWEPDMVKEKQLQPRPGYYAISATLLAGQFMPQDFQDYFARFRPLQPLARIGYCIYLYKIEPRALP